MAVNEPTEFFSSSFWEEISDLDELGRRAYAEYLTARDALFAAYGRGETDQLHALWSRYCDSAQTLDRMMLEAHTFIGPQGN